MTMPTFEPVAWELQFDNGNTNSFTNDRGLAAEFGECKEPLFTESQLQQAYEAGKRDAVPEWSPMESEAESADLYEVTIAQENTIKELHALIYALKGGRDVP